MKRGQITVFIIIGIILIASTVAIFYLRGYSAGKELEKPQETAVIDSSVQDYVNICLKETAESALIFIGQHGGYYELPEKSDKFFQKPYYFYDNKSYMLSKSELESQLSKYINNGLFFCTRNFIDFEKQGYTVQAGDVNTVSTLENDKVTFSVTFPITIQKESASKTLMKFSTTVPSRLGAIYDVAQNITAEQERNHSSVCVSCLADLSIKNDLRIEMRYIDSEDTMFIIKDEKSSIKGKFFEYSFINRYNWSKNESAQ